jgi:hypothetical protein
VDARKFFVCDKNGLRGRKLHERKNFFSFGMGKQEFEVQLEELFGAPVLLR